MSVKQHTAETRQQISRSLMGKGKTVETRASMATSKTLGFTRDANPEEWDKLYNRKLARIRAIDEALALLEEEEKE